MVTSLDFAKRGAIRTGLRQVHWDLAIVDEAHRLAWTPPSPPASTSPVVGAPPMPPWVTGLRCCASPTACG